MQDGHGVRDVDHLSVLADLGNEVTVVQIVRDGHAHAQYHHVLV